MDSIVENRKILLCAMETAISKIKIEDKAKSERLSSLFQIIQNDSTGHFLSLAADYNKVSYARNAADQFNKKKRVKTTLRRFLRRQLNANNKLYPDDLLDRFGCYVLSCLFPNISDRIKLLSGEEIAKFYKDTFVRTCMTGKEKTTVLDLYINNPDKVKLVILDNYVRAFLWNTDNNEKVLDRIYPNKSDESFQLKRWAMDNSIIVRRNNAVIDPRISVPFSSNNKHYITMNRSTPYYPYLDSFRFGSFTGQGDNSKLILSNYIGFGDHLFIAGNGGYYQNDMIKSFTCFWCQKKYRNFPYDQYNSRFICEDCAIKNINYCKRCGFSRMDLSAEEIKYKKDNNEFLCCYCLVDLTMKTVKS